MVGSVQSRSKTQYALRKSTPHCCCCSITKKNFLIQQNGQENLVTTTAVVLCRRKQRPGSILLRSTAQMEFLRASSLHFRLPHSLMGVVSCVLHIVPRRACGIRRRACSGSPLVLTVLTPRQVLSPQQRASRDCEATDLAIVNMLVEAIQQPTTLTHHVAREDNP